METNNSSFMTASHPCLECNPWPWDKQKRSWPFLVSLPWYLPAVRTRELLFSLPLKWHILHLPGYPVKKNSEYQIQDVTRCLLIQVPVPHFTYTSTGTTLYLYKYRYHTLLIQVPVPHFTYTSTNTTLYWLNLHCCLHFPSCALKYKL